jgi:NADH:ubiquinone oxidoreductase subunit 4 (subunit M)
MKFFADHILSVILYTPLVGALLLLFVPREMEGAHRIVGNLFGVFLFRFRY